MKLGAKYHKSIAFIVDLMGDYLLGGNKVFSDRHWDYTTINYSEEGKPRMRVVHRSSGRDALILEDGEVYTDHHEFEVEVIAALEDWN